MLKRKYQTAKRGRMKRRECFCLNYGITPDWFIDKVTSKDIECIYSFHADQGKIIKECRFYDTTGRERVFYSGNMIAKDMIYPED